MGDDTLLVLAGFEEDSRVPYVGRQRRKIIPSHPIPRKMLENRVIARLPRAMMAALSTAIGRWVITRSSSLPLHRAFKDTMSHRSRPGAVITRSFFLSTAFNLNRPSPTLSPLPRSPSTFPPPLLPRVESSKPLYLFLEQPLLSISSPPSSLSSSRLAFLFRSPRETRCFYPTDHDSSSRRHVITWGGGGEGGRDLSPVMDVPSMDGKNAWM